MSHPCDTCFKPTGKLIVALKSREGEGWEYYCRRCALIRLNTPDKPKPLDLSKEKMRELCLWLQSGGMDRILEQEDGNDGQADATS